MICDMQRDKIEKGPTLYLLTLSILLRGKLTGKHTRQPRHHGHPQLHWKARTSKRMLRHQRDKGGRHYTTDSQATNLGGGGG